MMSANFDEYYKVLSADFPEWLHDYINTKELQTQKYISVTCGIIYSELFNFGPFYSSFDHSIAVALVVWHFTHDKKQTLAGLFHDISTPAFKHCVDFMNGDHMKQESTEGLTSEFIRRSDDAMKLLKRDGISLEEIDDYHIYPIADNDTPQLSADRLEYSFSNALWRHNLLTLDEVRELYEDIEVQRNETGEVELGFKTKALARKFVLITSKMSVLYRNDKTRYSMQFLADILKRMCADGLVTVDELYDIKESDLIERIQKSKYGEVFRAWQKAKRVHSSATKPEGVYFVKQPAKIRYIDPLCRVSGAQGATQAPQYARMSKICKIADKAIKKNLAYDMNNYVWLNFDF